MKLLLAHPGASFSTHDVYEGLSTALAKQGHELVHFRLDHRIGIAGAFLKRMLKNKKENATAADVLYLANQLVLERALRHQVDWVLIVSGMYFHPDFFVLMKRAGLRVAALFTESPYDDERQERVLPFLDICWTNERTSIPRFRRINPNTFYLPHAYNPEKHFPRPDAGRESKLPEHDVVFVGTGFEERAELLGDVDWDGIDLGLYGHWSILGPRNHLRQYLRNDEIDNDVTSALYRKAKIGINLHRTSMGFGRGAPKIGHAESLNPRAYELAACGCFYISDDRAEVREIFGESVPTFSDAAGLKTQITYWLEHDGERKAIAAQLPRIVREHNWENRAEQMMKQLSGVSRQLYDGGATWRSMPGEKA